MTNESCEYCGAPVVSVGYPDGSVAYECADSCSDWEAENQ